MKIFGYILVAAICCVLVNPTEAWRGRRALRKVGSKFRRAAKKVFTKKNGCRILFGVGCPVGVGAAGAAVAGGSGGTGALAAAAGVAAGKLACRSRRKKCKRSVSSTEILLPFSDDFRDYDYNGDKLITYEEFVFAVMKAYNMADPGELTEPFIFADANDDNYLDMDEFVGAPFLFAHFEPPTAFKENIDANTIEIVTNNTDVMVPAVT